MTESTPARRSELDGLRGLAILLVMSFHFLFFPRTYGLPLGVDENSILAPLVRMQDSGWIGVDLFFVLSGFLITGILDRGRGQPRFFRDFYIRRTLRIFPLYFLVLAALFTIPWPLGIPANTHSGSGLSLWTYASNILIALAGWDAFSPMFGHLWTLAVEEQFYLLWPLAITFLSRRNALRFCGATLILCPAARACFENSLAPYVLTPFRIDAFAAGALLALAISEYGEALVFRICRRAFPFLTVGMLLLFLFESPFRGESPLVLTAGLSLFSMFFASLLGTALGTSWLRRLFSFSPLRVMGRISYGLYLVHQPVCLILIFSGVIPELLISTGASNSQGLVLTWLACTAVSVAISVVTFLLIEMPMARLKERMTRPQGLAEISNTSIEPSRATGS